MVPGCLALPISLSDSGRTSPDLKKGPVFRAHCLVWVCLLVAVAADAQVLSVPGATSSQTAASAEVRTLLTSAERDGGVVIVLPDVTPQELSAISADPKTPRLQIGFRREIPAAPRAALGFRRLVWKALPHGLASSAVIRSLGAVAIRAAMHVSSVPEGVEIRFFSLTDGKVYEPLTAADLRRDGSDTLVWSPVVEGDAIGIEWFVPNDAAVDGLAITIPEISHLLGSVMGGLGEIEKLKASGSCAASALSPAQIQLLLTSPERRVRAADSRVAALLAEGLRRSATFGDLVVALHRTNVIVYIQTAPHLPRSLDGRLMLTSGPIRQRYLRIQIRPDGSTPDLVALIGHELRHAIEIGEAPEVADERTLIALYERIGYPEGQHGYDTVAARDTGRRVRMELGV